MKGINNRLVVRVVNMKKVTLSVEFVNENNEVCFGVLFFGVMTRRSIYLKEASTSNYVKINRKDVKIEEHVTSVYDGIPGISHWSLSVPEELGLDDPRIIPMTGNEDIIADVKSFVEECDEVHEKISRKG